MTLAALAACGRQGPGTSKAGSPARPGPAAKFPGGSAPATGSAVGSRQAHPSASGPPTLAGPAVPGATCPAADLVVGITTDHASYRAGQAVNLTVTVRNHSGSPCDVPTGPCLPQVIVTDAAGNVVWNRATTQVLCPYGDPAVLPPGTATTQTVVWPGTLCAGRDPTSCPGGPVALGSYRASADWDTARYASTGFSVTR